MSLKLRYWLLVGSWHLALFLLVLVHCWESWHWVMLSQLVMAFSLWLAYRLFRAIYRPMELVESGTAALQDRDFSVKYLPIGNPETDELVSVYNQMIDSLRQERTQVEAQQQFLIKLIEASPVGVLIQDFDHQFVQANPAALQVLGFDPCRESRTDHPVLAAAAQLQVGENQIVKLDGSVQYRVEVSAFIERGFHRRFIQLFPVGELVLEAEKRAYGKVIRMMAHEVNNSIGAVNALLQTFSEPPSSAEWEDWLADLQEGLPVAIDRNQRLNIFMRNFAKVVRLPPPQRSTLNFVQLLHQLRTLLQPQADQQETLVEWQLPEEAVLVTCDASQLEQVVVNVYQNALESLGQGGNIRIRLTANPLQLIVADNGPGLSDEVAASIFTPFFTTKPTGQGIGLTLVREILHNHAYAFQLQTEEDGWTRFVVSLQPHH